ncbi:hypothetical protein SDJN02_17729, partial [Cucurbita argyrosperma subsp. argyrosperma]
MGAHIAVDHPFARFEPLCYMGAHIALDHPFA